MIENYIGKPIKCDCGKEHRSRMDVIEIKKGVIENELVVFLKENGYKRLTVVCDKNTYRVVWSSWQATGWRETLKDLCGCPPFLPASCERTRKGCRKTSWPFREKKKSGRMTAA